jgi:hypothetical protein
MRSPVVFHDKILQATSRGPRAGFLEDLHKEGCMKRQRLRGRRLQLDPVSHENLEQQILRQDGCDLRCSDFVTDVLIFPLAQKLRVKYRDSEPVVETKRTDS